MLVDLLYRAASALPPRAVAAFTAGLIWIVTGACQREMEKYPMPNRRDSLSFESLSGVVVINPESLESMKTALLDFFDDPEFPSRFQELRNGFVVELKASAPWISGGLAGVGVWRLESKEGHLTLVRYPAPSKAASYLYHASLIKTDSGWKVGSFEQERELGPE